MLCPGSSINEHKEKILNSASNGDTMVISVNFIPDFVTPDCVFCANTKRLNNISNVEDVSKIITSNLLESVENDYDFAFSFNNCVYFNEEFCEDSTLMLLKVLSNCGCRDVYLAGFDGFASGKNNYYSECYTKEKGKNVTIDVVRGIITTALDKLQLHFVTPSLYEDKK